MIAQVWRNTGSGFSNINAGLPGVYDSSVAWGDYDNDGRLDFLLTGNARDGALQPSPSVAEHRSDAEHAARRAPTGLAASVEH